MSDHGLLRLSSDVDNAEVYTRYQIGPYLLYVISPEYVLYNQISLDASAIHQHCQSVHWTRCNDSALHRGMEIFGQRLSITITQKIRHNVQNIITLYYYYYFFIMPEGSRAQQVQRHKIQN